MTPHKKVMSFEEKDFVISQAYGLLWASHSTDAKVHGARKLLLSIITKEQQRKGVEFGAEILEQYPAGLVEKLFGYGPESKERVDENI